MLKEKLKHISVNDFRLKWGDSLRGALFSPVVITVRGTGTHVVMSMEKYKEIEEKLEELIKSNNKLMHN